jgi:hypothetical protein
MSKRFLAAGFVVALVLFPSTGIAQIARSASSVGEQDNLKSNEFRTWTCIDGRESIEKLRLDGLELGLVQLIGSSGNRYSISIAKLSDNDREYISRREGSVVLVALQDDSVLSGDPDIEAATNAIRERNLVKVEKTIHEIQTICEIRYCKVGIFGRRTRAVTVQRQVMVPRTVSEVRDNLDNGIGWDQIGDSRLGFYEDTYPVKSLPAAAGARGTKINLAASTYLKDDFGVDSEFNNLDRILVRTPRVLPTSSGPRELVRVEAKVGGLSDDRAVISIKVQQRDAAGNFISNSTLLNSRAKTIWDEIKKELDK